MYTALLLVLLVGLVWCGPDKRSSENDDDVCQVSGWHDWGPCISSVPCENVLEVGRGHSRSYALEKTMSYDTGRAHMGLNRFEKTRQWNNRKACKTEGGCPQFNNKATTGPAECVSGTALEYPCHNVDLLAFVNFADMGDPSEDAQGNDIWGWTDPDNGDEYAIMGLASGTSFVRVTDPNHPLPVAWLPTRTVSSDWRDVKVVNNHAFIVSEASNHGMQIYDLTQLRPLTTLTTVTATANYSNFGNAHNIVSNEDSNFLYAVGNFERGHYKHCNGGLHMIDVRKPLSPEFVGCYNEDGYTHDAQCVIYRGPDPTYFQREVCFNFNEDSLTIVDVTDKDAPVLISKEGYAGSQYTHQGWLTEDQTTLLLDDELDEYWADSDTRTKTYVWDVSSLDAPKLKNILYSSQTSIDHNQYILGDLVFQSNYEAGLRILHVDQEIHSLRELAYFDVLPSSTTANFAGTWSNYPYFSSGNVVVSSIDYGLYIVRPRYDVIREDINDHHGPYAEQVRTRDIVSASSKAQCPNLVETRECQPPPCH